MRAHSRLLTSPVHWMPGPYLALQQDERAQDPNEARRRHLQAVLLLRTPKIGVGLRFFLPLVCVLLPLVCGSFVVGLRFLCRWFVGGVPNGKQTKQTSYLAPRLFGTPRHCEVRYTTSETHYRLAGFARFQPFARSKTTGVWSKTTGVWSRFCSVEATPDTTVGRVGAGV